MFGTKDAIIRYDMSEYSDRTAVSKLIGTTAGYVGYDDNNNTLTRTCSSESILNRPS